MKEFTTMHVKAALKAASENVTNAVYDVMDDKKQENLNDATYGFGYYKAVDKDSILNSYDLNLIK